MQNIVDELLNLSGVVAVQLTGSQLSKHNTASSDIDLVVYTDTAETIKCITRTYNKDGTLVHWNFAPISSIILAPDTIPCWRIFGNMYLLKLTGDDFWSNTCAGKYLHGLLLKYKYQISLLCAKSVIARLNKIAQKISTTELFEGDTKSIFNVLYAAKLLDYIDIDEKYIVDFKHQKSTLQDVYSNMRGNCTFQFMDTHTLMREIDEFNKMFYNEFQTLLKEIKNEP